MENTCTEYLKNISNADYYGFDTEFQRLKRKVERKLYQMLNQEKLYQAEQNRMLSSS
jgi:hypothetical protein